MNTKKDVIPNFRDGVNSQPHVVILGAGASKAAFPNGDKNGRQLPLMNSLVQTLQLEKQLSEFDYLFNDFEKLYSTIGKGENNTDLLKLIEEKTFMYFYEMEIHDTPTMYDYLILSLREKDIIATFNWDPLLLHAFRRHGKWNDHLPQILFLHGNVAVGVCEPCNILGYKYNSHCHRCNSIYSNLPLLYPIEKKDYNSNIFIKQQWDDLIEILKHSYYVTIYGYSAPSTDVEARSLILKSISDNRSRVFTELDIIDIKPEAKIEDSWSDYFYSHHYGINHKFQGNYIWHHPRRSCDAHASAYLMNAPWGYNTFPEFKTIEEMHKWIEPLIEEEACLKKTGKGFKPS